MPPAMRANTLISEQPKPRPTRAEHVLGVGGLAIA
jgi:hypothetical protein